MAPRSNVLHVNFGILGGVRNSSFCDRVRCAARTICSAAKSYEIEPADRWYGEGPEEAAIRLGLLDGLHQICNRTRALLFDDFGEFIDESFCETGVVEVRGSDLDG